ncbi:NAD(P)-dependent alcohol dehydrogenase [Mucilaginibacter ginsenosidivorans]|uniref:NAD(P)-dependent alcohol dehydrogenase n=1 Tax=Mucilaginibacter ginsenosidivorans TaxID=398053 RepID=A0A5B8V1M1_9SPHI|nr:NAD(P)-dependent alcohol dehydrogenase [Mucilaginibacter ginsenosidivorans]QEC65274.1 NAD(P)-dependent alcohol dehydrogenase [Mucilaginibacter ginsenosidivorans]
MIPAKGYAAPGAKIPLEPFKFERRDVGPHDVQIEILFSGVCHSDIHQARDEWGGAIFPMVPGHEIVGRVVKVGDQVTQFKTGDIAGVGVFVDSCRHCPSCVAGLEQYCDESPVFTYSSIDKDGNVTYGGYSNQIVVDEKYTLRVSEKLPLAGVAPLLCAGITTWSPIQTWQMGKGHKVGVVGLGGLGHMAVKFAVSKGAEVTVLSTSPSKKADAEKLGAHHFVVTKDPNQMAATARSLDFIINTVSAQHEYDDYLQLLKLDGTMVLVGIPPEAPVVSAVNLISKRRRLAGSMIGGIKETQEMLDYCAEHNIVSEVEVISMDYINEAFERVIKGDVRYRFVIDMASL